MASESICVLESVSFVDASESTMSDASVEEESIKCLASESIWLVDSVSLVESITGNASVEEERIKCLASDSILFVESVSLVEEE